MTHPSPDISPSMPFSGTLPSVGCAVEMVAYQQSGERPTCPENAEPCRRIPELGRCGVRAYEDLERRIIRDADAEDRRGMPMLALDNCYLMQMRNAPNLTRQERGPFED